MLAARKDDGRFGPFTPVYGTTPGIYRPTLPAFAPDPAPGSGTSGRSWSRASRCCARGPRTPLTSRAYARDLNEIKDVGALHSTTRTAGPDLRRDLLAGPRLRALEPHVPHAGDEPAARPRRQRAAVRDREPGRRRRRDRLLEQQVPLEHVAADHRDPRGRERREPGHRRPTRTGCRCSIRPRRSPRRRRSSPRRSRSTPQATTAPPARSWARSGTSSTPTASRSARPATRRRRRAAGRSLSEALQENINARVWAGIHFRHRRPRGRRARQEGRALPPQPRPPAPLLTRLHVLA